MSKKKRKNQFKKEVKQSKKVKLSEESGKKSLKARAIDFFSPTTKKAKIISFGTVAVLAFLLGAGTSNQRSNTIALQTVATYDGGKIHARDLYSQLKNTLNGSGMVLKTLEYDVFYKAYGNKISNDEVERYYSYYVNSGITTEIVGNDGISEKDAKELVKKELAFEYGIKQQLKATDKEKETVFQNGWQPDQDIQFLSFDNKAEADKALAEVQSGRDLGSVSNYDKIIGSQTKTVSYSQQLGILPDDLYSLKTGDTGLLVSNQADVDGNPKTYYYVVKMVKANQKGKDWKKYSKELSEVVKQAKISKGDKEVNEIIKKEFAKAHVIINDSYMKKALADYVE